LAAGESAQSRAGKQKMARETEIKLRITDLAEFRRALTKLGARSVAHAGGRVRA
jgi:hypothetical protein